MGHESDGLTDKGGLPIMGTNRWSAGLCCPFLNEIRGAGVAAERLHSAWLNLLRSDSMLPEIMSL